MAFARLLAKTRQPLSQIRPGLHAEQPMPARDNRYTLYSS